MEDAFSCATNPKYRLDFDDFVKTRDGTKLYRVVALRDFGDVEKGQKGGYVEGEHNLFPLGRLLGGWSRPGEKTGAVCRGYGRSAYGR